MEDLLPPLVIPSTRPRVIPVLLLREGLLYKPIGFSHPKYVGDPRVAVKIFNDKGADELVLLDMDASLKRRAPNLKLIEEIVNESFMPIAYGGGIHTLTTGRSLLALGVEKIVLNSALQESPALIGEISAIFGAQSVVACLDVKKDFFGRYHAYVTRATRKVRRPLRDWVCELAANGVGEVILQSIEREGKGTGYDLQLIHSITSAIDIPVIALGGAGRLEDFSAAIKAGAAAVAAGSMFVFNGPHRAVLISYPTDDQMRAAFDLPPTNSF